MKKFVEDFHKGRTKFALHQGLFLIIAKHMDKKQGWLGDLDDLLSILKKKDNSGAKFGTSGGNHKHKKEAEGGIQSSQQRGKVVMKEESKDFEEDTPLTSSIAE